MTKSKQSEPSTTAIDAGAVVRLVMAMCTADDEELIRAALGNVTVASIPAVAKVFGVKETTVRNTWRRDGMPGDVKRGAGQRSRFVLADIALWALKRADEADAGRRRASSNGHVRSDAARDELGAIELESARLALQLRRSKVAEVTGDLVSASLCRSELASYLSILRDDILEIPRHVKPFLPAKLAETVVREIDRLIRLDLTRISEQSQEQILEKVKRSEQSNGAE